MRILVRIGPALLLWGQLASAQSTPPAAATGGAEVRVGDKGASGDKADKADKVEKDRAGRRPQVRTYSTVTVLDDPAKAPPLPTLRRETEPTEPKARPTAAEVRTTPPGRDDKPDGRTGTEPREVAKERAAVRELRDQLRSERREQRDRPEAAHEAGRPSPRPPGAQADKDDGRAAAREQKREMKLERAQRRERLQKD